MNAKFIFLFPFLVSYSFAQHWEKVGEGLKSTPYCLEVYKGNLYAVGYSLKPNMYNESGSELAKWDGQQWSFFAGEINSLGFTGKVSAMTMYEDDLLIV